MKPNPQIHHDLYARIVRGILHADSSTEEREPSRTYELLDRLKEVTFLDEDTHQRILSENENCIEYWLRISIASPQNRRFLLQIARANNRSHIAKEHVIETNHDYFLAASDSRHTVLRVYSDMHMPSTPTSGDETDKQARRSSSFLKRWVRAHGRAHSCLTQRIADLPLSHSVTRKIDGFDETSITMVLERRHKSGTDFDPLETEDLIEVMRCLIRERFAEGDNYDKHDAHVERRMLHRIAKFYGLPMTQIRLLAIGICLEHPLARGNFEFVSDLVAQFLPKLKLTSLAKETEAVPAAEFLAVRLMHYARHIVERQQAELFLPIGCEFSTVFLAFEHHLEPILKLVHLNLWDVPSVSHLKSDIRKLFQEPIKHAVALWLVEFEAQAVAVTSADLLTDKIDRLHICLGRASKIYEPFFRKAFFSYVHYVIELIDAKVDYRIGNALEHMVANLDPRNKVKLSLFTRSTMKLFDALKQFMEFVNSLGYKECALSEYERHFERPAIFWTTTWRINYLNFVKQTVESSEHPNGNPPQTPSTEEKTLSFFQPRRPSMVDPREQLEMHDSTVNCIAFCYDLCYEFVQLNVKTPTLGLLCVSQIVNTLADCLSFFAVYLRKTVYRGGSLTRMLRALNGIDHASSYLAENYPRFLDIPRVLRGIPEDERDRIGIGIKHIMEKATKRCDDICSEILEIVVSVRATCLKKHCKDIAGSSEIGKKTLASLIKHVFTPENTDQLHVCIEKSKALRHRMQPRLFNQYQRLIWKVISETMSTELLMGQPPAYYEGIKKECENICNILNVHWSLEKSSLRERLFANSAETRDLVLQYYSYLADVTMSSPCGPGTPRIAIKAGYMPSTNDQILLHVLVISGSDIPILDSFSASSDPYLRLELYPRPLFPLSMYPPETTDTKKKNLNPKWYQSFQMAIPSEYFFTNGCCLCLTVLDHDVMSYNDLAGQALLPLGTVPRLKSLCTKDLPPQQELPLVLPVPNQYSHTSFEILEERSTHDAMAHEVTYYEKYLRDYRILPPNAMDSKEYCLNNRLTLARNRQRLKHAFSQLIRS